MNIHKIIFLWFYARNVYFRKYRRYVQFIARSYTFTKSVHLYLLKKCEAENIKSCKINYSVKLQSLL